MAGAPRPVFEIEGLPAALRPGVAADTGGGVVTDWQQEPELCLAVHGQVFNIEDIAAELSLPSASRAAQVLASAWQRWGTGLLPRLDGVFALAVADASQVHFYCDPSSLARLFVRMTPDGQRIDFTTHLAAWARRADLPLRLARRSLHEYLRFLDIAAPNTVYDDVMAVEPGRLYRWSAGGLVGGSPAGTERKPQPTRLDFENSVSRLDELLTQSICRRLAGVRRPAAFLSGGVDSALLCALAARQRPDLTAVTVGFDDSPFDEAPLAAAIAAHLGVDHQVLRFSRTQYLDALDRLVRSLEQPMADPATLATVLAFEHCATRFDAVLDGTGADEAVGAMPARHVRLAVQYGGLIPRRLRLGIARGLKASRMLSGYAPLVDFEHPANPMIRWHGFERTEIESLCGEPVSFESTQFYRTYARYPRGAHYERYSALLNAMPCDRLGQATLVTGLMPRYPFAEPQTVRFLQHLPLPHRHTRDEPKRVLRALLARHLPRALWDVPKHGFDFPLQAFLAGDDHALVRRYLDAHRWRISGWLNPSGVSELADRFVAGDQRLRFRVWALVVLGAWLEHRSHVK